MITPKKFTDNINKNIITTTMLEAALFSVNKRAKNYRDKEREYRYSCGTYSEKNRAEMESKKKIMYKKKEMLLSVVKPTCIHKEIIGYERVRVYEYESEYSKKHFYHYLHGTIVWQNCYYDWEQNVVVSFFDYIIPEQPIYNYYLYYVVGTHTFHSPIKNPENYQNLQVKEIGRLETLGMEITDLVSMQFVDKMLNIVAQNDFEYVEDIEDISPKFPNNRKELLLEKPQWNQIWNYIVQDLKAESKKQPGNIRLLTEEEKSKITIRQKCKKPSKKMKKQGMKEETWKKPEVRFPEMKLKCPIMSLELRNYIEENYKDNMGKKEFAWMLLQSPLVSQIQEDVYLYCSMRAYSKQLQKKADMLYENTHGKITISDLL